MPAVQSGPFISSFSAEFCVHLAQMLHKIIMFIQEYYLRTLFNHELSVLNLLLCLTLCFESHGKTQLELYAFLASAVDIGHHLFHT